MCLQSQPPPVEASKFPFASKSLTPPTVDEVPSFEQETVELKQLLSPLVHSHFSSVVSFPQSLRGQVPKAIEVDSTARKEEARRTRRGISILVAADSPALKWGLSPSIHPFIGGTSKQDFPQQQPLGIGASRQATGCGLNYYASFKLCQFILLLATWFGSQGIHIVYIPIMNLPFQPG